MYILSYILQVGSAVTSHGTPPHRARVWNAISPPSPTAVLLTWGFLVQRLWQAVFIVTHVGWCVRSQLLSTPRSRNVNRPNTVSTGGTELLLWFSHWCWLPDCHPSPWHSLGIYTGWVLGWAAKGGTFQARPPADQDVNAVLMCRFSATDCSALSSQHFLSLCSNDSHPLLSPDQRSSASQGWFL